MVLQETNREDLLRFSSDPLDTAVYRTRTDYTYVYGLGLISITDSQGNQRYVLPDALGSARTLSTGADGSAYATYSYDTFDSPRTQDGPHTTFRFAGEQYDLKAREQGTVGVTGTNGLYYLRARYYDPTIGRFLTRDPLPGSTLAPQSLNRYPYAQNNPANRVDPTGMLSESTFPLSLDCLSFALGLIAVAATAAFGPWGILVAAPLFVVLLTIDAYQQDYPGVTTDAGAEITAPLQFAQHSALLRSINFWAGALAVGYDAFQCLNDSPEFQT